MRVAIDGRAARWTGVGRYVRSLVQHLVKINSGDEYVLLISKEDLPILRRDAALASPRINFHVVDGSYYSWREHVVLRAQLARVRADLFHFTHFNVPLFFSRPYVVTVHDATRFFFSGQTKQDVWSQVGYEYVFAQSVARAKVVVCVSETTKSDLQGLPFRLAPATVIYEAVGEEFFRTPVLEQTDTVRRLLGFSGPYLLYVGVWMDHKNVRRMVEAFARAGLDKDVKLVVTGQVRKGYVDLHKLVAERGMEDRVLFPGFVPHALLPTLYHQAQACLFPSLYEGFGLPPLEAMASGTAVIASHVSSLPEVLGEAAVYVNPEDTDGLTAGIRSVMINNDLRAELVRLGRLRAREFSWEAAARDHWLLDQSVLK